MVNGKDCDTEMRDEQTVDRAPDVTSSDDDEEIGRVTKVVTVLRLESRTKKRVST